MDSSATEILGTEPRAHEHHHDHGPGGECTCKEKLYAVKKQLRARHLQRRQTLKASGVVIAYDQPLPEVQAPAKPAEPEKFNMKDQFTRFQRRLTSLAEDAAKIHDSGLSSSPKKAPADATTK